MNDAWKTSSTARVACRKQTRFCNNSALQRWSYIGESDYAGSASRAAARAGDHSYAAGERFLFEGFRICRIYSSHQNSSAAGPLFLCETHPTISVFRALDSRVAAKK